MIRQDTVEIVVQINGKVRDKMTVSRGMAKEELEKISLNNEKIKPLLVDKTVIKVIVIPDRIVNIVVK